MGFIVPCNVVCFFLEYTCFKSLVQMIGQSNSNYKSYIHSMTRVGTYILICRFYDRYMCCDMGQNDTIGKIELNSSFVLSSDNTNCKNDIQ